MLIASRKPPHLPAQYIVNRHSDDHRRQILNMLQRSDQPLPLTDFVTVLIIHQREARKIIRELILAGFIVPIMKQRKRPGKDKAKYEGPVPAHTAHKFQRVLSITPTGRRYCELMNSLELMIDWEKRLTTNVQSTRDTTV